MIDSWWQLGEGYGQSGSTLAVYQIECAFCGERGNFSSAHLSQKKKPNGDKVLNFQTLKCGNCAGYVMVLWSASEGYSGGGLHDYRVLPYPLHIDEAPDYCPNGAKRFWVQAHDNLISENYDAAAVMARSALQVMYRDQGAAGKDLKEEINDLKEQGIVPSIIVDWSHEVRELGNDAAHGDDAVESEDARDIVKFLDYLSEYLYALPAQIAEYRKRRQPAPEAPALVA